MYCLINFYIQTKDSLFEHLPMLKVAVIMLVVFLSFWQTFLITILVSSGAIKPSSTIQAPDITIGIPSMLLCIEMSIYSVFSLWAFPWKVYDIRRSKIVASESVSGFLPGCKAAEQGGRFGQRALADAFNPWNIVKTARSGFRRSGVGKRRHMVGTSYKSSHPSAALEPTRNQFTAFQHTGNGSFDLSSNQEQNTYLQKPSRYTPLSTEEDSDHLLAHSQSNPFSASLTYPRPMERAPPRSSALGEYPRDTGTLEAYDPPPSTYHHPNPLRDHLNPRPPNVLAGE
ncbi:MAG: hypothetical protein Q9164_007475, partial [Protoblastenia rupestris]